MAEHKSSWNAINVIGQRYGRLVAVGEVPYEQRKRKGVREIICKCDCGNMRNVKLTNLRSGNTKSCGCFEKDEIKKRRKYDLIGKRFGRLVVCEEIGLKGNKRRFRCICDCGNETKVLICDLLRGYTKSCGCYRKEFHTQWKTEDITGRVFNGITAIRQVEDFVGHGNYRRKKWLFQCSCGKEFEALAVNVKHGKTRSCGHYGKSQAEYDIMKWLDERQIDYDYDATFDDLRNPATGYKLHFDIVVHRNDGTFFIIEHQGIQHFTEGANYFGWQQKEITDGIKRNYCKENNIKLYETLYNEDYIAKLEEIIAKEIYGEPDLKKGGGNEDG